MAHRHRACRVVPLVSLYIHCATCACELIRDDFHEHRQALEARYGDPAAKDWTVELQCPVCAKFTKAQWDKLERERSILREMLLDEFVEKLFQFQPDLTDDEAQQYAVKMVERALADDTEEDGE